MSEKIDSPIYCLAYNCIDFTTNMGEDLLMKCFCKKHFLSVSHKSKKELVKEYKNSVWNEKQQNKPKSEKQKMYDFIYSAEFECMRDAEKIEQLRIVLGRLLNGELDG